MRGVTLAFKEKKKRHFGKMNDRMPIFLLYNENITLNENPVRRG